MTYVHFPLQLPVLRDARGYGLSLKGGCPTLIARVDVGSPAERVGFLPDDVILRVNNQSVEKMNRETVARIIK